MEVLNTVFAGIGTLAGVITLFVSLTDRQRRQLTPALVADQPQPIRRQGSLRSEEERRSSPPDTVPQAAAPLETGSAPRYRFFDPTQPQEPAVIQLEPFPESGGFGPTVFRVTRQLGYLDPQHDEPFVFPADPGMFVTDLQSVPMIFSWLVPASPSAMPALILHDALIGSAWELPAHIGPTVTGREADRIFRDALREGGIGASRRWLIWASAALATMLRPPVGKLRVSVFALWSVAITFLNVQACLDVVDRAFIDLPWLIDGSFLVELASAMLAAVVIPMVTSFVFGRDWKVVAIFGTGYSVLFIPILLNAGLAAMFVLLDRLITRWSRWP